jgi:hypothetical protein
VEWCKNALEVAKGAEVLVILTEWNEFRALDLKTLRKRMLGNVLVDLRNIYPEALAAAAGFVYHGIGRTPLPVLTQPRKPRAGVGRQSPQRHTSVRQHIVGAQVGTCTVAPREMSSCPSGSKPSRIVP